MNEVSEAVVPSQGTNNGKLRCYAEYLNRYLGGMSVGVDERRQVIRVANIPDLSGIVADLDLEEGLGLNIAIYRRASTEGAEDTNNGDSDTLKSVVCKRLKEIVLARNPYRPPGALETGRIQVDPTVLKVGGLELIPCRILMQPHRAGPVVRYLFDVISRGPYNVPRPAELTSVVRR